MLWLSRAVFKCGSCARRTVPCRKQGCKAFARGRQGWDEDMCFLHRKILASWADPYAFDKLNPVGGAVQPAWWLKVESSAPPRFNARKTAP